MLKEFEEQKFNIERINKFGEIISDQHYKVLENLGNTCYMNSFLIALFMTNDFRKFIVNSNLKMNSS